MELRTLLYKAPILGAFMRKLNFERILSESRAMQLDAAEHALAENRLKLAVAQGEAQAARDELQIDRNAANSALNALAIVEEKLAMENRLKLAVARGETQAARDELQIDRDAANSALSALAIVEEKLAMALKRIKELVDEKVKVKVKVKSKPAVLHVTKRKS